MSQISIHLNGAQTNICSQTLKDLIEELRIDAKYLAVAVNNHVIAKQDYPTTHLAPNDHVEVIKPVCGG